MSHTTHTTLDRAQSLRLVGPHRVLAQRGSLWLTCDGESADWVLDEGMSMLLDGSRPALVTAIGAAARVAATPLAPPTLTQRFNRWWHGLAGPRSGRR